MARQVNRYPGVYSYQTQRGRKWAVVIDGEPDPATVARRQVRKHGFPTREAAIAYQAEVLSRRNAGELISPSRTPLRVYLEEWLDSLTTLAPRSRLAYRGRLAWVCESIGHIQISSVTPAHLERVYADRLASGAKATTIASTHATLRHAFNRAVEHGLIRSNPATLVKPPSGSSRVPVTLDSAQMRALLAASAHDYMWGVVWRVMAEAWIRVGELSDLRWGDIDLRAKTMTIAHQVTQHEDGTMASGPLKTAYSRRTIALSDDLCRVLRAYRDTERERIPAAWTDEGIVFPSRKSYGWLRNATIRGALLRSCAAAGLPPLSPHCLRHSGGSIAYRNGVDIKTVSERLGHANVGFTLQRYMHPNEAQHRDAAGRIAELLAV